MRASVRSGLPKIIERGINGVDTFDSTAAAASGAAGCDAFSEFRLLHADNIAIKATNQTNRCISIFPSGSPFHNKFVTNFGQYSRPFARLP
jgi:hypothetical protein